MSKNIKNQSFDITQAKRNINQKQNPKCIWFEGLSGSGKSCGECGRCMQRKTRERRRCTGACSGISECGSAFFHEPKSWPSLRVAGSGQRLWHRKRSARTNFCTAFHHQTKRRDGPGTRNRAADCRCAPRENSGSFHRKRRDHFRGLASRNCPMRALARQRMHRTDAVICLSVRSDGRPVPKAAGYRPGWAPLPHPVLFCIGR